MGGSALRQLFTTVTTAAPADPSNPAVAHPAEASPDAGSEPEEAVAASGPLVPKAGSGPLSSSLRSLDLGGNRLGGHVGGEVAALEALGELLRAGLPSLHHLSLEECGLRDGEVAALAAGLIDVAGWAAEALLAAACGVLPEVALTAGGGGGLGERLAGFRQRRAAQQQQASPPSPTQRQQGKPALRAAPSGSVTSDGGVNGSGVGAGPAAPKTDPDLGGALRAWLAMGDAEEGSELRRSLNPGSKAATGASAALGPGRTPSAAAPVHASQRSATSSRPGSVRNVAAGGPVASAASATMGAAAALAAAAQAAAPKALPLAGLACLLSHPTTRHLLERLKVSQCHALRSTLMCQCA